METAKNIEHLTAYFRAGCTPVKHKRIGVEVEHFIVDQAGNPAGYDMVTEVMKEALQPDDVLFCEEDKLFGYYNSDFSISLEPAAQLEISVMPQQEIERIKAILQAFYRRYEPLLAERGYHMVTLGCHPACRAEELPLIPKKRYEYMNDYFKRSGTRGMQMMRATASTQVSIDYESEEDFAVKYRLAAILTPVLALLTDNSPIYEGKAYQKHMARTYIWQDVDNQRCGIPKECLYDDFGFEAYAHYLYETPAILIKENKKTIYTDEMPIKDYYDNRELTEQEIEHILSMFFPDVRLKHYIEIRMADSMPYAYVLAYLQLLKGIFYEDTVMHNLIAYFGRITIEEISHAKTTLIEKGYEGCIYGRPVTEIMDTLFAMVQEKASEEEKKRLEPLYRLVQKRSTLAAEWVQE